MEKEELIKILKNNFEYQLINENYWLTKHYCFYIGIESKRNLKMFKKLFDILNCVWYKYGIAFNPVNFSRTTKEIIQYLKKENYYPYYVIKIYENDIYVFYGLNFIDKEKLKVAARNLKKFKKLFNTYSEFKILKIKKL
jgi:hypothetical protein